MSEKMSITEIKLYTHLYNNNIFKCNEIFKSKVFRW